MAPLLTPQPALPTITIEVYQTPHGPQPQMRVDGMPGGWEMVIQTLMQCQALAVQQLVKALKGDQVIGVYHELPREQI